MTLSHHHLAIVAWGEDVEEVEEEEEVAVTPRWKSWSPKTCLHSLEVEKPHKQYATACPALF